MVYITYDEYDYIDSYTNLTWGRKTNLCKTSAMQKGTAFRGAMCIPNQFPKSCDINQMGIDHALYSVIKDR